MLFVFLYLVNLGVLNVASRSNNTMYTITNDFSLFLSFLKRKYTYL